VKGLRDLGDCSWARRSCVVRTIVETLNDCTMLTRLELMPTNLDDDSLRVLAALLPSLPQLRELRLELCEASAKGAGALLAALRPCRACKRCTSAPTMLPRRHRLPRWQPSSGHSWASWQA
jgi:hypothetical protein